MKEQILVLGDSISNHYGEYLKVMLKKDYSYITKSGLKQAIADLDNPEGSNSGDSTMTLDYIKTISKRNISQYKIIVLNCGLHDIKTNPISREIQVSLDEYELNLIKSFTLIKKMSIFAFWVNTTPVVDHRHNRIQPNFYRYNNDVLKYNLVAERIANQFNIKIIDLYNFTKNLDGELYCDHVHFNKPIRRLQAAYITGHIMMHSNMGGPGG